MALTKLLLLTILALVLRAAASYPSITEVHVSTHITTSLTKCDDICVKAYDVFMGVSVSIPLSTCMFVLTNMIE